MNPCPFNPLDTLSIGKSICSELERAPVMPLSRVSQVIGSGIYAIYYVGSFEPYTDITKSNADNRFLQPIYVGKAVPSGTRKGGISKLKKEERPLFHRLAEHARTISEAENLKVEDFFCRSLWLDEMWIFMGESMLIEKYQPLWNRVLDGFGNKTPGKGRASQQRSTWDTLHPGRKFVEDLGLPLNSVGQQHLLDNVRSYLKKNIVV